MTNEQTAEPRPDRPAPWFRTICMCGLALTLGITVADALDANRSPTFEGRLRLHASPINSPAAGEVVGVSIRGNQRVELGTRLGTVRDESRQEQRQAQQEIVADLETKLRSALSKSALELQWRQQSIDSDILELELRIAEKLKQRHNYRTQASARREELERRSRPVNTVATAGGNFSPAASQSGRVELMLAFESARNAAETVSAQIEICERRLSELRKLRERLPDDVQRVYDVAGTRTQLDAAQAELRRLASLPDEIPIVAHTAGYVRWQQRSQDRVEAGESLGVIVEPDTRYIQVVMAEADDPGLRVGDEFQLIFPGGRTRQGRLTETLPPRLPHRDQREFRIEPLGPAWPDVVDACTVEVLPETQSEAP